MSMSRGRKDDLDVTFEGSMAAFYKMCIVPLILEVVLAAYAIHAWTTIPIGGDATLRNISTAVPGFWAVMIPLVLLSLFLKFSAQSLTLNRKSAVFRQGRNTTILNWHETLYTSPSGRFDRQMMLANRESTIVVRSLFFPEFDRIQEEIERIMATRQSTEYRL